MNTLGTSLPTEPSPVTALNVLIEPDAVMLARCEANNARLLEVFPHGFTLDDAHRPHITLLQRFVHTGAIDEIHAAAQRAVAGVPLRDVQLEAFRYYYIPSGSIGLAGIVAAPHPALVDLQRQLIEALEPFTVATGDSAAFVTTPAEPVIDPMLIHYVTEFVPASTGERFSPHVTTGIATREYLDAMLDEPFDAFTFSPAGAAIYQLGQYGTAARRLRALDVSR